MPARAAMPTRVPAAVPTAPPAPDHDVRAAVIVVVTARVAVIAAIIIGGRAYADAYAKRPRVETNLRHCRCRRGPCYQPRRTNSKRQLSHYLLLLPLRSERETRSVGATFLGTRLKYRNLREQYFRKNLGTGRSARFTQPRAAAPLAVAGFALRRPATS